MFGGSVTPDRVESKRGGCDVTVFTELTGAGVPVSLKEYLTLIEALDKDLAGYSTEQFYFLSRAALVKDERNLDRFDRVFGHVFKGLESPGDEASFKLFVVLTTGNEAGSNTVTIARP